MTKFEKEWGILGLKAIFLAFSASLAKENWRHDVYRVWTGRRFRRFMPDLGVASEKQAKKGGKDCPDPLTGCGEIPIIGVVPVGKAEDAPDEPPGGLIEGFGDVLE